MSSHFGDSPSRRVETMTPDRGGTGVPDEGAAPRRGGGFLRAAGDAARQWFVLVLLGSLLLGWCGTAYVISPFLSPARRRQIGRRTMQRVFGFYLRLLDRAGLVHVDHGALDTLRGDERLILAPNHPSLMDVILVIARLDNVGCIMKADLWNNPFLGAGARMAGFIRNDSPRCMIRLAIEDLARGSHLLIFPEATRTVRDPVNPLTGGFALIAKRSGAPVQTILIETDSPYLRKGWPLFRRPSFPIRFRLRLGRRFEPDDDVDGLVAAVEQHYRDELGGESRGAPGRR